MARSKWCRNFDITKRLGLSIGWFRGNESKVFAFGIWHKMDDMISIVDFQIAKFIIELTWFIK